MNLLKKFKSFKSDESGAVTVDWVVLTAAIVGLGIAVVNVVGPGITGTGTRIAAKLNSTAVGYTGG